MVVNPVNVVNPPATETGPEGPQGPPGAPGPTIYPPAGIAVSTGTAWGTSIPAADVALLNAANTFTTDQTFNGTGSFVKGLSLMNPGLAVGDRQLLVIGVDAGAYDGAYFGFSNVAGSGGTSHLGVMSLLGGQETTFDVVGNWHFPGTVTSGAVNLTETITSLQERIAALEAKLG